MRTIVAIAADVVVVIAVYLITALIRVYVGAPPVMMGTIALNMFPFAAIHVVSLAVFSAYDFSRMRSASDLAFSAALGVLVGTLGSFVLAAGIIVYQAPAQQPIGRSVFIAAYILNSLILCAWRQWYAARRMAHGERCNVLIVGNPAAAKRISDEIREYAPGNYRVVGYVLIDSGEDPPGEDCLGNLDSLPQLIKDHVIEEVLLLGALVAHQSQKLLEIIRLSTEFDIRLHIVPGLYESLVGKLDLYQIGGIPLIGLKNNPLTGTYALFKRAMDLACALLGLVVLSPILLAAAVAIKLDSSGSVFYRQTRCGLRGREFQILKLRSMRVDAEAETGPVRASKDDPRITRIGRFLRSKRLDEVPQLWNVLKGDMSLVGPRPERPFFVEQIVKEVPLFQLRLRVRPGLTALSQVWGRYTSAPIDRLRYDLVYLSNVSFLMDMRVLLETVKTVITGRGAQ